MRKAQSMLEYTVLMIIIVAAFLTMQVYIKRGFQGRWKQAADDLGDQYDTKAFNSTVRHVFNNTSSSRVIVQHGVTYNGRNGMLTFREDKSATIETKNGVARIQSTGL
jgi:hypothetical protein